jgi:N utilization substance protein A
MNNFNVLEALSQIAREKNVDRELVVQTLAEALISAAQRRYGNTDNFDVKIDSASGQMEVVARKIVVQEVNEPSLEITLPEALDLDSEAQLGSEVIERLDFADFGRNAIQTAKQILIQRVREAEREYIYSQFSGRCGQIESGIVQQISRGDIILNLGRAEAAIPYKEQIRRERYRQGDAVRGYIYEVLKSSRGPQVLLSRTHPEFLRKLFAIEVPEIAEGIVEIHAVSREPGERAKIAVSSSDERVDPVGACVGVKGSRVQAVVRELSGERIDIVPWSEEPEVFLSRALSPAIVSRVIADHRRHHATVIVEESQLSLAIGKSGQNSRLAVQLTGWGLDIISEDDYQDRRAQIEASQHQLRALPGVSELIALSLATSGFTSIRSIAEADLPLLQTVPGLESKATAKGLKEAAEGFVAEHGTDRSEASGTTAGAEGAGPDLVSGDPKSSTFGEVNEERGNSKVFAKVQDGTGGEYPSEVLGSELQKPQDKAVAEELGEPSIEE